MGKTNIKQNLLFIKRRLVLVKFFYFFITLILVFRLFKLQIIDYFFYKKKSDNNYLRKKILLPKRGIIFDRNMIKICDTKVNYKLLYFITKKEDINDIKNVYNLLNRDKKKIKSMLNIIEKKVNKNIGNFFVLAYDLSAEEIKRLKFNNVYFPKMRIENYYARKYFFKNYTSALIGYISRDRSYQAIDFRNGSAGIEKIMDKSITGHVGLQYNVINAAGKRVDKIIVDKPIDGADVITSIDQDLQNELSRLFLDRNGAATLIDVRTGSVLAMVSSPSIDPNLMSSNISDEKWKEIIKSEFSSGLFTNKNISSLYQPGSTFKIVTALTSIIKGIDPKKKYKCTGEYIVGNRIFRCHNKKGHGLIDLNTAIVKSCNCYFYDLSQQIGSKDICDTAKQLGLCDKHLQDFDNELSGFIGNSELFNKKYNKKWWSGDSANLSIGQGYVSLTPLQLAVMIARIATNKKVEPKYLFKNESEKFISLGYNEKDLMIIRKALYSSINNFKNNSFSEFVKKKYQICGKTGTAQVVSKKISLSDIKLKKVSVNQLSNAIFVGYAPFNDPRYAVSVVVEHGNSGAKSALPIGIQILSKAIDQEGKIN